MGKIKMWRQLGTLQKRVSEVESELMEAFHLRLVPHSDASQKISRRLQKRFAYISNLLSAEAASTPTPDKNHQFLQIGEKLAQLEAVFRWWNEFPDTTTYAYLQDDHDDDNDSDSDSDSDVTDSPQVAAEEEGSGRIWGGLCRPFGGGLIVGALCCVALINFSSFCIIEYQDTIIYDIYPT